MLRQPMRTRISGTSQPTLPTEPATIVRTTSITVPGSCHQTAAALTMARATSTRPTPSRRCSGSSSRAVRPMLRAVAPSAPAIPIQTARSAVQSARKNRRTGPGPERTARGAGRDELDRVDFDFGLRLVEVLRLVLRDRELEVEPLVRLVLDRPDVDVLLLRDPGGEDVRVAMPSTYGNVTPVTRITVVRVGPADLPGNGGRPADIRCRRKHFGTFRPVSLDRAPPPT